MSRLFYMSLFGVGRWDDALKQVGAQLRPYQDFLWTAKKAAIARKPVLAWREADGEETREFEKRLDERWDHHGQKARQASRRRDRHTKPRPVGVWVVLEPPPWQPEEPDETFEAFLDATSVHEHPACRRQAEMSRLDFDREGLALLLARLPQPFVPTELDKVSPPPPTAAHPHGRLVWLSPNTYTLERQIDALDRLDNAPSPRQAPLVRLASTEARWVDVMPRQLYDGDWQFLKETEDGRLRDGTDEQRRFVSIAMGTEDFAILEGPPGSGKTTAICELIAQVLREGKRVLLVASTHVAVDNVLERMIEWQDDLVDAEKIVLPVRIGEEDRVTSDIILPFTLRRVRQTWRDELQDFLDAPHDVVPEGAAARQILKDALSSQQGDNLDSPLVRLILDSSNLVCGTTIGILQHPAIKQSNRQGTPFDPFDLMILDEASKTTFSEFLVPALHARKWVIVGDIKQLSPYVEEVDLAENLRGLVPAHLARFAAHSFVAALPERQRARTLLALGDDEAEAAVLEARARDASFLLLDAVRPSKLRGVPGAIPELLYADLVMGTPGALVRYEHRLPLDLLGEAGAVPDLPDWRASRRAYVIAERRAKHHVELADVDWADEVAWRLVRSYELRQNPVEKARYNKEIESLLPVTLDASWFEWRRTKPRTDRKTQQVEAPRAALRRELETIRRVAMPSILEILQTGFERLPGWEEGVVLTDGLPGHVLRQRLVSLRYQHRMHPHISAFSRQQFYTPQLTERQQSLLEKYGTTSRHADWFYVGVDLQDLQEARHAFHAPQDAALLRDADGMSNARHWPYTKYSRHALWVEVDPGSRRSGRDNVNEQEANRIMEELRTFVAWAAANPRRDDKGRLKPWEVAILPFYRKQEALLRKRLQQESGQYGNARNFRLPRSVRDAAVMITLCTVDRFQGHEADLVFLSFVKSGSVGFLNSPNRLNVALTRARYQIVLVGHRAFFGSERCRSTLLRDLANSPHYTGDISWEAKS
jgi:hypothetical protein